MFHVRNSPPFRWSKFVEMWDMVYKILTHILRLIFKAQHSVLVSNVHWAFLSLSLSLSPSLALAVDPYPSHQWTLLVVVSDTLSDCIHRPSHDNCCSCSQSQQRQRPTWGCEGRRLCSARSHDWWNGRQQRTNNWGVRWRHCFLESVWCRPSSRKNPPALTDRRTVHHNL